MSKQIDEKKEKIHELLSIYEIYSLDNRNYNNVIWQFPTALLAANGLVIKEIVNQPPFIIIVLPIINFAFIHAIFKLSRHQKSIIFALQKTEKEIKEKYPIYDKCIPDFKKYTKNILNISSTNIICWTLLSINILFFLFEAIRITKIIP